MHLRRDLGMKTETVGVFDAAALARAVRPIDAVRLARRPADHYRLNVIRTEHSRIVYACTDISWLCTITAVTLAVVVQVLGYLCR